ncbi:MAG TPA: hypothetical protein VIV11_30805 [Kofleriaceae bacterium]
MIDNLEAIEHKLKKRGFNQTDVLHHECPACHENAVRIYGIGGKLGGRDIRLCLACGVCKSFRSGSGMADRVEDDGFDLDAFLR